MSLRGGLLAAGGGLPGLSRLLPGGDGRLASPERATGAPGPIAPTEALPLATPPGPPLPSPAPTPAAAGPFTMNLYEEGVFVHEVDDQSCVAAAAQGMLNVIRLVEDGREPDASDLTQQALYDRIVELTTADDSHNGGTGPGGWAALLSEEGYPYEVRAYESRLAACAPPRRRCASPAARSASSPGRASTRGS